MGYSSWLKFNQKLHYCELVTFKDTLLDSRHNSVNLMHFGGLFSQRWSTKDYRTLLSANCFSIPFNYQSQAQCEYSLNQISTLYITIIETQVFQMKSRKSKTPNTKKPVQIPQQPTSNPLASAHLKQFSGHTKVSTNCTIHITAPVHSDKKAKNKKASNFTVKQAMAQLKGGTFSSKSNRKCKGLELPLNVQSPSKLTAEESFREYCVVDQNFVPLSSQKQLRLFQQFFSQTASTSYGFHSSNTAAKAKEFQGQTPALRKRSTSSQKQKRKHLQEQATHKQEKAVSNFYVGKVYTNAQIQAIAQSCEIGMQYSQRKQLFEERSEKTSEQLRTQRVECRAETAECRGEMAGQQSLADLLFKLEFTHLVDDKSFGALSQSQKLHFSQLLESVVAKLSNKDKDLKSKTTPKSVLQPISFSEIKPIKFDSIREQDCFQSYSASIQKPRGEQVLSPYAANFQKLQELITRRQLQHKNLIMITIGPQCIDTSHLSILHFLAQFFCYIQLNYTDQFVFMIRKMYGLGFAEKYRRVTRNLSIQMVKKFRVVDQALFLDFINESELDIRNSYEAAHYRAIFDAFNEHLQVYRPFYAGNGEPFPWSFKLMANLSEYSIDEDSLQIIFRQAKDKIFEWAQNLCGMLVQYDDPLPPKNPLEQIRQERLTVFIKSCVEEQNFEKDGVQLFATQTLHDASQEIFQQLIEQLARDAAFLFI